MRSIWEVWCDLCGHVWVPTTHGGRAGSSLHEKDVLWWLAPDFHIEELLVPPWIWLEQWFEDTTKLSLYVSIVFLCFRTGTCSQPPAISDNDREILFEEKTYRQRPCCDREPCHALHLGSSQPIPFWQLWLEGQLFNSWGNFITLLCCWSSLQTHQCRQSLSQTPVSWGREGDSERRSH